MKLTTVYERPSALLPVCTQVSGAPVSLAAAAAAHETVGHVAVRVGLGVGTSQIQAQRARIQGRISSMYGLKAKDTAKVDMTFGDVRGVPPRGRPV